MRNPPPNSPSQVPARPPWAGKMRARGKNFSPSGTRSGPFRGNFAGIRPAARAKCAPRRPPSGGQNGRSRGVRGKYFRGRAKFFRPAAQGLADFRGRWGGFLWRWDLAGTGGRATFALAFGDDPGARFFEAAAMRGAPRERAPRRWIATAAPGRPGAGGDFLTRESLILAQDER